MAEFEMPWKCQIFKELIHNPHWIELLLQDPNRNFDILHGRVGSSNDACQDTFHGDSAFSEQESRAVRDAVNGLVSRCQSYNTQNSLSDQYVWWYSSNFWKAHLEDCQSYRPLAGLGDLVIAFFGGKVSLAL